MARSMCPLDCFDNCSLEVEEKNGQIISVAGDKSHHYTKGFICSKGQRLLERVYSPDRLLSPMEKKNGRWRKITWANAYEKISTELNKIIEEYGSQAILHIHESGSNGVLKLLSRRFFNCLGGVTVPEGGLCWEAGNLAQQLDFGEATAHLPWDVLNSKTIILWGRDPAITNIHLLPYLKEASNRGAKIIVINPLKVKSIQFAAEHIAPKPGTDFFLAIGMAHHILKEQMVDFQFIRENVSHFEQYARMVAEIPLEKVSQITGVAGEEILSLAEDYARNKPAAIILGYGLQRYSGGLETIRAIDSLGAITGNIGLAGGGVSYNFSYGKKKLLSDLTGEEIAVNQRTIPISLFGKKVQELNDPPVKAIFTTCANPVTQLPNTTEVRRAFHSVDFKVTLDFNLTDTVEMSDLVLPVTTIFEEEQFIANSMSPLVGYVKPLISPRGECKPDAVIFSELAELMGLDNFGSFSPRQWIEKALNIENGLEEYTLDDFKEVITNPYLEDVPWKNKKFLTPSGKIELLDTPIKNSQIANNLENEEEFPFIFLTPHPEKALHSQFHHENSAIGNLPRVLINPKVAKEYNLRNGNEVIVFSQHGEMRAAAQVSDNVRSDTVVVEEGWWFKEGASTVNLLTSDQYENLSLQALYYDCKCNLRKVY